MANGSAATDSRCLSCGFEASPEPDNWQTVDAPPFGTLTQCPECESTNIVSNQ